MGCGSGGASKTLLRKGMGWLRSRFSARMGKETITVMARRMDRHLLLGRFEL